MSDTSYKNQALGRFYEAAHLSEAVRLLRVRVRINPPPGITPEIHAQRSALVELAARLIESQIPSIIELGIYEWYRAHDKETPSPASTAMGSGDPRGTNESIQSSLSGQIKHETPVDSSNPMGSSQTP